MRVRVRDLGVMKRRQCVRQREGRNIVGQLDYMIGCTSCNYSNNTTDTLFVSRVCVCVCICVCVCVSMFVRSVCHCMSHSTLIWMQDGVYLRIRGRSP